MIDFSLPKCLSIPVPYLIQKKGKRNLLKLMDEDGFSMMHWAVAQNNIAKVQELKKYDFSYNIKSKGNTLPISLQKLVGEDLPLEIPFTIGGFTPLHLNTYLYKYFETKFSTVSKGGFSIENLMNKQFTFFKTLDIQDYSLKDKSHLTVTDYCFLLENFSYINEIIEKDPQLLSLVGVSTHTAYEIVKNYKDFMNTHKDKKPFSLDKILATLEQKKNYESLNAKLFKKNMLKSNNNLKKI